MNKFYKRIFAPKFNNYTTFGNIPLNNSFSGFCFSSKIKFKPQKDTCYYKILNVNSNASHDEIKKEYYKLAKKYHPDNINEKSNSNQSVIIIIILISK